MRHKTNTLSVSEIFYSIQGEGLRAGMPCILIRLSGCNLRCSWCDSSYAFEGGIDMTIDEIVDIVKKLNCPLVQLTGGEPLNQQAALALLSRLADEFTQVLLETNGSCDIGDVDERVVRIVDFKCPSSGQDKHNHWSNVEQLRKNDEVKFVIASRDDFDFAINALEQYHILDRCVILFSPITNTLPPDKLAKWILQSHQPIRLNLQLHKILWPDKNRGV